MRHTIIFFSLILFSFVSCFGQTRNENPKKVEFVTADINRFWSAFDSCKILPEKSKEIYDRLYFDKGTTGLKAFKAVSIKTTDNLVNAIEKYRLYYTSIRQHTLNVEHLKPELRKSLIKFKRLYPGAKFPNIYFLMGDINSGGKSEKEGLLIGCEVNCADSSSDFTNIYSPFIKVLKSLTFNNIPLIVVHELVHYQQSYADSNANLLGYAIKEGSAEFICKLVTGHNTNSVAFNYGQKHEKELWQEFIKDSKGYNLNNWLYNVATKDRPKDLGYYLGYKITESYYVNSKNKRLAIQEILNIKDFNAFLKESKYGEFFNNLL